MHHLGPGEGFGEEDGLRVFLFHLRDEPFPETKSLGMWIIYTENTHSLLAPEQENALQFLPELAPVLGFKVKRVNVLVFLGWVLGILNGSVRSPYEPLWMFLHIGMVGGTLNGDIQGDFDAVFLGFLNQMAEVLQSAKLGMDGFVPAFLGTDGPWRSRVFQ